VPTYRNATRTVERAHRLAMMTNPSFKTDAV